MIAPTWTIQIGDSRQLLAAMPDKSVHCCVTSPPYYGLRDYGHAGQIGLEQSPEAYVAELVAVFREVKRVLRDDGTLWLNLGDSYANGGRKSRATDTKLPARAAETRPDDPPGLKPKDLIGIPWRVAFALQADGWYLRQDIIWHKPNAMPESVQDRCTKAHEYIFLLSKSQDYYYDAGAIAEPATRGAAGSRFTAGKTAAHQLGRAGAGDRADKDTRNKRGVWAVPTASYSEAHFATFPPDLIRPCIRAGCPVGGTVLDPFNGAGTTGLVCIEESRNYHGLEINPEYVAMTNARLSVAARQLRMFA